MTSYRGTSPLGLLPGSVQNRTDGVVPSAFRRPPGLQSSVLADKAAGSAASDRLRSPAPAATDEGGMLDMAALVPAAAAILDEETAAGMRAARETPGLRAGSSRVGGVSDTGGDEQWLRDLHELVDALGEVLPRIQGHLADSAERSGSMGRGLANESAPVLRPKAPVRPGQSAGLSLGLDNDDAQPAHVALYCTDLLSATGMRIPQQQVTVTPSRLQLGPDAHAAVTLKIAVPPGIPPGEYSGLLLASGLAYFRAVVAIEVL